jgi:hypothetical protein
MDYVASLRQRRRAGLALVVLVVAGVLAVARSGTVEAQPAGAEIPSPSNEPLLAPDQAAGVFPNDYTKPASVWQTNEKAFYTKLISSGRFDLLIVPCQVQQFALDRATRSLITAQIALAVAAEGKQRTPDPYLVARALGDGERRFDRQAVFRLADSIEAKQVLWCYIGHDRKGRLRLTIQHVNRSSSPSSSQAGLRSLGSVAFSDEVPPAEAVQALLPQALQVIGVDPAYLKPVPKKPAAASRLPDSPLALASDTSDPARNALRLQLLASLTPARAERSKERLIEKSLLALQAVPPASREHRVLKARAFMQLGLRVAALKLLGQPRNVDERYVIALLNGNLPEAEQLATKVSDELRFLATLDVNEMASQYGVRTKEASLAQVPALKLHGTVWPSLAQRALVDWDLWSQFDNANTKAMLDSEFPIPGYTLESIARGARVLKDAGRLRAQIDLSVITHTRRVVEAQSKQWCCLALAAAPSAWDYLELLEAIGTDNLMRAADFSIKIQNTPENGLRVLAQIEGAYKDHPQFALARASAQLALAQRSASPARDGLVGSAYSQAWDAVFWEQGQTRTADRALRLLTALPSKDQFGARPNPYASDYPFKGFYWTWEADGRNPPGYVVNAHAALANSAFDFDLVEELYSRYAEGEINRPDEQQRLIDSLRERFQGHPQRAQLLALNARERGDTDSAIRYYNEGIAARPGEWSSYLELGKLLFEEGLDERAAKTFLSYPAFSKSSDEHPVNVANHALEAGSLFYWSGNFAAAKPLYRIAADLETGSEASMASDIRLRLLEGDYQAAMRQSLQRARRYGTPYAYRDYLGMLHAMGRSEDAWAAFDALLPQMEQPQIWETALVGHRKQAWDDKQMAAWAAKDPMAKAGPYVGYSALYLVRAGTTDRKPGAEWVSLIEAIERPVWKLSWGPLEKVVRPSMTGGALKSVGSSAPLDSYLPAYSLEAGSKVLVVSDLVYFARGYEALRRADYRTAKAAFDEASTIYHPANPAISYMLPYYAFAAAKAGDVSAVQALLDGMRKHYQRRFDYQLARAVIAALGAKPDEALRSLKLALHRRPYTEERPLYTEYQYAEIVEWLFAATGDTRYREVVLAWARANQSLNPWYAWPHAMVAKHSRDPKERQRAIAMTQYLDVKSERLSGIDKKEIEAATRDFAAMNPFLRPGRSKNGTI